MTTEIKRHPYRQVIRAAYVTLDENVAVHISDVTWEPVLGPMMKLPGGCEIDVRDTEVQKALADIEECDEDWEDAALRRPDLFALLPKGAGNDRFIPMVPVWINDADLPPAQALVRVDDLKRCQRIEIGSGTHARGRADHLDATTICRHPAAEITQRKCRGCFRRWWMREAVAKGIING